MPLFDPLAIDSTPILDYRSVKATTLLEKDLENAITSMTASEKMQQIQRLSSMDIAKYESIFMEIAQNKIIERRVSNFELELFSDKDYCLEI